VTLAVVIRSEAADDIRQTVRYLAFENLTAAADFELDLTECLLRLSEQSGLGARVKSRPVVRRFRVSSRFSNWLVFYRQADAATLDIVRVLHGARDVRALLREMK
jgi:plasmid stabilization system protein ParE